MGIEDGLTVRQKAHAVESLVQRQNVLTLLVDLPLLNVIPKLKLKPLKNVLVGRKVNDVR